MFHEKDPLLIERARTLRKQTTDAEKTLWKYLSFRQIAGYHFRRQHPIGPYIVDFACTRMKVAIELDGSQHAQQKEYDEKRTDFLKTKGYRVLRFCNNDVLNNMEAVYDIICEALNTPTQPPPEQGEEE